MKNDVPGGRRADERLQELTVTCRQLSPIVHAVATVNAADPVSDQEYVLHGTYGTEADAIAAAQQLIDEQLRSAIATGLPAGRAFQEWTEFGEIPVVTPIGLDAHVLDFDPFSYAIALTQRFAAHPHKPQAAPNDLSPEHSTELAEVV